MVATVSKRDDRNTAPLHRVATLCRGDVSTPFLVVRKSSNNLSLALGGAEGSVRLLLTKTPPMFLLVTFAFQERGISFEQPAVWPLQLLTSLWGARGTRTRRRHGLSLVNVRTVSYPLLTVHSPASTVAMSRLAAPPDARSVSRGGCSNVPFNGLIEINVLTLTLDVLTIQVIKIKKRWGYFTIEESNIGVVSWFSR